MNSERIYRIYDRFLEIYSYMDKKYVDMLEELVFREAEILSKQVISEEEIVELWGIGLMKKIIAEELGLIRGEEERLEVETGLEEAVEAMS